MILDEAGMTADADLARILHAAARTGAIVLLVGDPRQLAPVGPGGALAATLAVHPEIVTTMGHNVRQHDPAERAALLAVRHGDPDAAIDFYAAADRIRTNPDQLDTLHQMAKAWAADTAAGHDTLMLAWRRDTVAKLNLFGRVEAETLGRIRGDDLTAPGGRAYAVGDQVVTLAPNYQGDLVTSQRGTVTHIDHQRQALTLTTDKGRHVTLSGEQIDAGHLDHGYALTVHRTQGATADRTHYLAEGGGRELAYVALSRARHRTTIHAVADNIDQARHDLAYQWHQPHAEDWISLTHQPATGPPPPTRPRPADPAPAPTSEPLTRREQIVAELARLNHGAPPDVTGDLAVEHLTLDQLHQDRADPGTGRWQDQPEGHATQALHTAQRLLHTAQHQADTASLLARPRAHAALHQAQAAHTAALERWTDTVPPAADQLDHDIITTQQRVAGHQRDQAERGNWLAQHPEQAQRIHTLERELLHIDNPDVAHTLDHLDRIEHQPHTPHPDPGIESPGRDLGGIGL